MLEKNGRVNPLGLFDLDRKIKPVGTVYKKLIQDWVKVLPAQSVCLQVPVTYPGSYKQEAPLLKPETGADVKIPATCAPANNGERRGFIVSNVSSIHGVETTSLVSSYAGAKAAVLSLTRSAAIEGKEKGIRVNAVLPGAIATPMLWVRQKILPQPSHT